MGHLPFPFLKHPLLAITLSLLLLLLFISFCCCYSNYIFSGTIFTLFVLVLSTSFAFIFSKIKHLCKAGTMEKPKELEGLMKTPSDAEISEEKNATSEEEEEEEDDDDDGPSQINELVCSSPDPSLVCEGLEWPEMDGPLLLSDEILAEEADRIPSRCLISSLSDDESLPKNANQLSECTEGSISDDDSLIEIALPDGYYLQAEEQNELLQRDIKEDLLPDFSPEAFLGQNGLMEVLSEINEEDNLIEIDITMGSIKCSRVEIEA